MSFVYFGGKSIGTCVSRCDEKNPVLYPPCAVCQRKQDMVNHALDTETCTCGHPRHEHRLGETEMLSLPCGVCDCADFSGTTVTSAAVLGSKDDCR